MSKAYPYTNSQKMILNWKARELKETGKVDWYVIMKYKYINSWVMSDLVEKPPYQIYENEPRKYVLTKKAQMIITMLAETGVRL